MSTKQPEKREPKGTPEWHLKIRLDALEEELRFLRHEVEYFRELCQTQGTSKKLQPLIVLKN